MNSMVSVGGSFVPFGHRIGCFCSKMGGFVWCSEMGFAVHGPSIGRYYQLSDKLGLPLRLIVSGLGMWEALLLS